MGDDAGMKIARVFPNKTKATPDDDLVFFGYPRVGAIPEVDEIHVSVAFTGDKLKGERLADVWAKTGIPVKLGGPAYKLPGGSFNRECILNRGTPSPQEAAQTNAGFAMSTLYKRNSLNCLSKTDGLYRMTTF